MPVIVTIAACSTALGAIMCIAVLLTWLKDGRPGQRHWLFAPFGLAVPGGLLLTFPDMVPWGGQIGWFLLTAVYGSAWLAARALAGRRPQPFVMLLPCVVVLAFGCFSISTGLMQDYRMLPRIVLFATFNGLAAREFSRMPPPRLQAATTLSWIFCFFCAVDVLRLPFALTLPAPLGPYEPQVWTIAIFNFMIVLQGSLLAVFITAFGREELAARHYHLATIDPLTSVGNRRALQHRISTFVAETPDIAAPACEQLNGSSAPGGIIVVDIDHFKAINDELGHGFGDVVIAGTANVASEIFGSDDVFRVGGEEFAVVIENATVDQVMQRAEHLRDAIEARNHALGHQSRRCTASLGVAMLGSDKNFAATIKKADNALYIAKRAGRNRVMLADDTIVALPENPPRKSLVGLRAG